MSILGESWLSEDHKILDNKNVMSVDKYASHHLLHLVGCIFLILYKQLVISVDLCCLS
jgi:hypothetical protein